MEKEVEQKLTRSMDELAREYKQIKQELNLSSQRLDYLLNELEVLLKDFRKPVGFVPSGRGEDWAGY